MNNKRKKFVANLSGRNGLKNFVISIVILIELVAIACVATYAWVETVSSIKIATDSNDELEVDTYVFTEAMIGEGHGTIDFAGYFKQGGDMHFSPASSADGRTLFFPKLNSAGTAYISSGNGRYRKGNTSDMNSAYLSITFKLQADINADFFFEQVPTFSNQSANMRVSVTSQSLGSSDDPVTTIYKMGNTSSESLISDVNGGTTSVTVEKIENHIKGKGSSNKLFSVGAEETKIVTINIWLQGTSINNDLPQNIQISNFGITSDLTPRHVTLIPTPTWDLNNTTEYFYAWCWDSSKSGVGDRLYKLELDENEHYSFDYNGTYRKTLFIRCGNPNLTTESMSVSWSTLGLWNKTADTTIPDTPVDPTYIIETISGGSYDSDISGNKSTGSWHDPATIKIATVDGQSNWGIELSATSYRSSSVSSSEIIETTNVDSQKHIDTVHAWPSKAINVSATVASSNYEFVGWYNNAEGTGNALSTSASFNTTAPTTAVEITYYAKFKEVRTITLAKRLDNSDSSSSAAGTLYVDVHPTGSSTTKSSTGGSVDKKFDLGATAKIWATANTGYTLQGIYTTKTGLTPPSSNTVVENGITKYLVTADNNLSYYARFTTNTHTVTASVIGNSGSTVRVDTETEASTCSKSNIKYHTSVTVTAIPAGGYEFDGWYNNPGGTGTAVSNDLSYSFTLGDSDVTYYAKFKNLNLYLTGYLNGSDVNTTSNDRTFTYDSNTGKYKLSYTFTASDYQYITIYDGNKAYHPGSANAGSGTQATQYNSYISGDDSNNPAPYYKWKVDACKGTTVEFTWDHSTKTLSWNITSRELILDVSNWGYSDAKYSIWVNNQNSFVVMTKVNNTTYKATVTDPTSKIIFVRMNGNTSADDWSYKWNQTDDLSLLADKNKFTINGYSYGSWSLS